MDDCIFCKIVRGDIPSLKLYEDDKILVILDRFPSSIGHTLVIPKTHAEDIYEMAKEEYGSAMEITSEFAKKIKEITNCDGINILQNNGREAGQTVFHTHIHIIPRYKNDNVNIFWKTKDVQIEELSNFAENFRKRS